MIKTTKTNNYDNINQVSSNMNKGSTILIDGQVTQDIRNECNEITCKQINVLKYERDLVDLEEEEEEEDDDENCTSTDQAEENGKDDEEEEERDLTNLTWLTELRNQTMGFVNMTLDEETKKDNELRTALTEQISVQQTSSESEMPVKSSINILAQQNQKMNFQTSQHTLNKTRPVKISNQLKRPSPAERFEMFLSKIKRDLEIYEESVDNYQSDIVEKPPFNYSHIIGMAMLENGRRVTLQQICAWIERKFAFFRVRKKWNNSIRHNLSLHPCFRKIGRNKEDKGKGGYWELGVDPKKCDRKRIRNRKSSAQPIKGQKKHLQAHYVKTNKRRQQNLCSIKKLSLKHDTENLKTPCYEHEYEELMLDEMDVQQNIDVMSTNTNKNFTTTRTCFEHTESHAGFQEICPNESEEIILANYINDGDSMQLQQNDNFKEFYRNCALNGDLCHANDSLDQSCQQQYKLGTIIISSTSVGGNMSNISPRTLNSFLTANPTKQLSEHQPECHNICYSKVEDVPQSENVIISSYLSNLSDDFAVCTNESKSDQCHNFRGGSLANSVTLDFSAFPAQSIQSKPNVIVEQLTQPSLNFSGIEISSNCVQTSSLNSSTTCTLGSQRDGDYTNGLVSDNFRPYIDGIDEAFQYLRSIDNTRNEDILDNLLDISVSDY